MSINVDFLHLAITFRQELHKRGVPFTETLIFDGFQWKFPFTNGDVILHSGSYLNDTCVESYGMPWDRGDVTPLTPEKMAQYLDNFAEWDALDPEEITDEDVDTEGYSLIDLLQSVVSLANNGARDNEGEDDPERDEWDEHDWEEDNDEDEDWDE